MTDKKRKVLSYIGTGLLALLLWIFLFSQVHGQSLRDCVVTSYTQEIGVTEATGNNDGEDVEKYLISTNLGRGYAWCAAFVNWNLAQCSATHNNSAWCPDWFPRHRIVWMNNPGVGFYPGTLPQKGDVFGIYFPAKNRIAHVGFIHEWKGNSVVTVEGNTNAAGSREGIGVMKKIRLTKQIYKVANWID